jgi:thioester reductase-like protein
MSQPQFSIEEFYTGKTVMLTGCTGFVGKVMLEKFLRSLPGVKKYYILIRPKRDTNAKQRIIREILASPCFDRVKKMYTGSFN